MLFRSGVAFPLITASGSVKMYQATTGLTQNTPIQTGNVTISVSATSASGNLVTCNNTVNLVANQPIVFNNTVGNIVAGTVYYVSTILSTTTFTISSTQGGVVFTQANASATAIGQQGSYANIVPGQVYYVYSVPSLTSFVISNIHGAPTPFS